jgi:hypothetical protein
MVEFTMELSNTIHQKNAVIVYNQSDGLISNSLMTMPVCG